MKTMYVVELVIAVVLFLIMLALLFVKRLGGKRKIASLIIFLVSICLVSHVGYSYSVEEPELRLKGEQTLTLQANNSYEEQGIDANYHQKNVASEVITTGEVDTTKPGTYTVKYKYTYGKDKVKEVERTVVVEDKEAPVITLKGKAEMSIYTDEKYKEPGYTVKDNVDEDLSKEVKSEKKTIDSKKYEIVYTVTDSSGNETTATRTVTLKKRPVTTPKPTQSTSSGNSNSSTGSSNANSSSGSSSSSGSNSGSTSTGPNSGVIYLTFDDGPTTDITPKVLDVLKQENVKATFFILNYGANKEYLVKREVNEGHSIGIHGYSHDYGKIYKSVDTYMENVTKLQDKIKKTTGITTYITRFPGGSSNTVSRNYCKGIMTKLTKEVVNRGFKYYDWNVSSGDAGGAKNKDQVYNSVVKGLRRNRSNVVLMHDFSGNTKTLNALSAIIQYGKKNGYTFKAITQDTPMVTHGVNN